MAEQFTEDQSHAFEDQEQFQAPPEVLEQQTPEILEKKKHRRRRVKMVIVGLVSIVLLIGLLIFVAQNMPNNNPAPEPTPTPVPAQGPNNTQLELNRLQKVVDEADPALQPFSPPPVDMEVVF